MMYLAFSILFSSLIFVVFKLYAKYQVQTIYAIITNYFVACTVGILYYKEPINLGDITQKSWFWGSLALGLLFTWLKCSKDTARAKNSPRESQRK